MSIQMATNPKDENELQALQLYYLSVFPSLTKEFEGLIEKCRPLVREIAELITAGIDNDPAALIPDMGKLNSLMFTLSARSAEMQTLLTIYKILFWNPKTKELSEGDRTLFVAGKIAPQVEFEQKLKSILSKGEKHITILQSILKYETQRLTFGNAGEEID